MTFKVNVLLVALLALCLAVPVVSADSLSLAVYPANSENDPQVINLGDITDLSISVVMDDNSPVPLNIKQIVYKGEPLGTSATIQLPADSSYVSISSGGRSTNPNNPFVTTRYYRITYHYVESTPEPTPVPSPYISVTELYSDNLGTVYRFQCMPDSDRIFYSGIVPYLIPPYEGGDYPFTSSQTVVEYRVPAGGTSVFSSRYATYPMTFGVISTTITAPPLTPAENQTYNPIPDPAQKPLTPFTSGKFQPTLTSGQVDVISKSPYVALLSNLNQSMQLPIMDSPDSIRNKLVPDDLENITGPLYDTAAGWAEFTNFVPRLIADTMIGVYSPFLSAIADCKSVLLSFTGQLAEFMKPIYILSPVFYLFIPDLVWIGVCLVLVLLIIHALLVFVLGEDTVVYFMGRDTIVADAIPDFPALEK